MITAGVASAASTAARGRSEINTLTLAGMRQCGCTAASSRVGRFGASGGTPTFSRQHPGFTPIHAVKVATCPSGVATSVRSKTFDTPSWEQTCRHASIGTGPS